MTLHNPVMKLSSFFDTKYLRTTTFRHSFNEILIGTYYSTVSFQLTLSDLSYLATKSRAVSLQQLSLLLTITISVGVRTKCHGTKYHRTKCPGYNASIEHNPTRTKCDGGNRCHNKMPFLMTLHNPVMKLTPFFDTKYLTNSYKTRPC